MLQPFRSCAPISGAGTVTIEEARDAVKEAALRVSQGVAGPETQSLAAKLEKVTGCSITELAVYAEDWPEA